MESLSVRSGFLAGVSRGRKRRDEQDKESVGTRAKQTIFRIVPGRYRNHFIAMAGEFVGTFMFLFLAFAGTQVANTPATSSGDQSTELPQGPNPAQLLYIALSFGFSLAVNAWIFYRVSGGLFNPAVTLGLCLVGAVPFARGGLVFIAQMLGSMASAGVIRALFPGPLAVTTALSGGTSLAQGVFIEMFLTAQLVFTILMLAVEKHKGTFLAPVGIGLSLFIAELGGVYYTGGSLNPARSFGPCVANADFPSEHWIYWVGPCLGAVIAAGFHGFIKAMEYETANPGQDFDDLEANAFNPDEDMSRPVVHANATVDRSTTQDLAQRNRSETSDGPTSPRLTSTSPSEGRPISGGANGTPKKQRRLDIGPE